MLNADMDKQHILKLHDILPWTGRSWLKEWILTAPDTCVLALRTLCSKKVTPRVTQPTWEHVLAQDTLFSLLQEAFLFPGSPQDPFLHILQSMVWVGRILTFLRWFLCPSEPGYHRAGCMYLITWKLCGYFCKSLASEPWPGIWSHFCFVERHQITFTLLALFRERGHVDCF